MDSAKHFYKCFPAFVPGKLKCGLIHYMAISKTIGTLSIFFRKFLINPIEIYSLPSDEKEWGTKNIPIFSLNK